MERESSPAYPALTPAGKRWLRVVEAESRNAAAGSISHTDFERSGISRVAAARGTKQVAHLGFVEVGQGSRRISTFRLGGRWRALDGADRGGEVGEIGEVAEAAASGTPSATKPAPNLVKVETPRPVHERRRRCRRDRGRTTGDNGVTGARCPILRP